MNLKLDSALASDEDDYNDLVAMNSPPAPVEN